MQLTENITKHFRGVYFGGNWTDVNLKGTLNNVTWQEATTQIYGLNTIATLTYHIHYFVRVVLKVLQGGALEGDDKLSFNHPPIDNQAEWEDFLQQVYAEAEEFAALLAELPEERFLENLAGAKYGNYYYNIAGIIEHTHYHLGQILVIKKILAGQK